ncbi:MAG TPA: 16S rRNA (guanine(966)-N(2))-methyltransferase RsmD [Terriglobia bacterium]|nr:16S rRNA (guanine(966)-N(2))-methyltransferase RsmD [Terriglobia bacterium]
MRIISGTYRGFHLRSLRGADLRPTSDQMRETLFDVLGPALQGARFLDVYAGSGAVGLEALSRGASEVVLVESHRGALEVIRRNLEALRASRQVRLLAAPAAKALERLGSEGAPFDFVFLDPPYAEVGEYHHTLRQLGRSTLLAPAGRVIAEHSRHLILEEAYGRLRRVRSLRHGDTHLSFYRAAEAPENSSAPRLVRDQEEQEAGR